MTTADPVLEPPIITVNTVLSLMALDYPANKLACYVSDDGCSPLTLYALSEGLEFARIWVPFCRKYEVEERAPFRYFSNASTPPYLHSSSEFQNEWKRVKVRTKWDRVRAIFISFLYNFILIIYFRINFFV